MPLHFNSFLTKRKVAANVMRFPFEIPTGREFEAVGFGLNAVDHLIVVPAYPAFDTKTRLVEHTQAAGGQTASAMVALRRLGLPTAYAGRFGSDAEGEFGLETLRAAGVDVEFASMGEDSGALRPERVFFKTL